MKNIKGEKMPDRYIAITDREAKLAAEGKLLALVRVIPLPEDHWWSCDEETAKLGEIYIPKIIKSPFGAPGDTVHLKEAWIQTGGAFFEAYKVDGCEENGIIMSPVTMPRNLIRCHYRVKEVRAVQYHECPVINYGDILYPYGPDQWVWYATVEKIK